jgi:hypothetical protein
MFCRCNVATIFLCSIVGSWAQACEDPPSGSSETTVGGESSASAPFRHDVVALAAQEEGATKYATGSLFRKGDIHYLITARHFAQGREQKMVAVFSRGDSEGTKVRLEDVRAEGATWNHLVDIDLSVLKVRPEHEMVKTVTVRELPTGNSNKKLTTLSPVMLIGVPLLLGVSDRTGVSPTVIRTEIANASVRLSKSDPPIDLYLFPVDLPSGFSGGVVTEAIQNEKQVLRGVVIKNTVDEAGGQFSVAVPVEVLAQLLGDP